MQFFSYLHLLLLGLLLPVASPRQPAWHVRDGGHYGMIAGEVYYQRNAASDPTATSDWTPVPVPDARVTVAGQAAVASSDAQGQFALAGLPAGTYSVTVTQPHFHDPLVLQATVRAGQATHVAARMGQVYYLFVGIGKYRDAGIERLTMPVHDVNALDEVLPAGFWGDSTLLLEKQATKAHIAAAFSRIAAQLTPDDYFLFYFSGHEGVDDDAERPDMRMDYLEPVDSYAQKEGRDIADTELTDWLAAFPTPGHVVLILDSCHSGGFLHGTRRYNTPRSDHAWWKEVTAAPSSPLYAQGYTVLASTDAGECAIECDEEGGLFTHQLVQGLTSARDVADAEHHHAISARDLFNYAAPGTTQEAADLHEQQHPQLILGGNPDLLRY